MPSVNISSSPSNSASAISPCGTYILPGTNICEDVSEIKKLRKKIRENEKVETIKEMIVTYNYEMNNILAVIIGKVELVLRKLSPNDENFKKLQDVLESSKKMAEIIKKIKDTKTIKVKDYDNDTKMIDINGK